MAWLNLCGSRVREKVSWSEIELLSKQWGLLPIDKELRRSGDVAKNPGPTVDETKYREGLLWLC